MSKKSDGVKDILDWLEDRCKSLKKELDSSKKNRSLFHDDWFLDQDEARLREAVNIKAGVEKYMKKLKYQGE